MKTIKKIFAITVLILVPLLVDGQDIDERQRTVNTIIADVLDQMPAQDSTSLEILMTELCETGVEGMTNLALLLSPPEKGENAKIEYALNGISHFVTTEKGSQYANLFMESISMVIEKIQNIDNKAFLISLFQNFGDLKASFILVEYLDNDMLADVAIRTIMSIPETEDLLTACIHKEKGNKAALAYAAGFKKLDNVEDNLLQWIDGADSKTKGSIYYALSQVGTKKSLPVLSKAAKNVKYDYDETDATASYIGLLRKFAVEKDTVTVEKETKTLLKVKKANIKISGMDIMVTLYGKGAMPVLLKKMKDKDRQVRSEALRMMNSFADADVYAQVVSKAKKTNVKIDVVNWLGEQKCVSQVDFVVKQLKSKNDELVDAAIVAIGKIGNDNALQALVPLMGGPHKDVLEKTLLSYKKSINGVLNKCLDEESKKEQKIAALNIISKRRFSTMGKKVMVLINSEDQDVKGAAYKALTGIIIPKYVINVKNMLASTEDKYVADVQNALINVLKMNYETKPRDVENIVLTYNKLPDDKKPRFYTVLVSIKKKDLLDLVVKAYNDGNDREEALKALLLVDNFEFSEALFTIAHNDDVNRDALLTRFVQLVKKSNESQVSKITSYRKALELNPSADVKNLILKNIELTQAYQGMMLSAEYLDDPNTAQTAANTILNIACKHPEYNGKEVVDLLQRLKEIINDSDASYKITQIDDHLEKITRAPAFVLSEEEKKEGFMILFDGTNLDSWIGDKTDYIVKNGNIYVTANYGDEGNLYTEKEYGDFVYRFEFCFLRSGVNNGVGIRTPMHVDAAYEGMEIQILDHDAPIYKGLREYQVHGSVYGIVPAKRLVFPDLGTWNTEEIVAKGDHIKVTVNNQVIVDADIRKACKGHNIAPDGSANNPYTVDKQNHPGLFNKKGHISFCGHGEGLLIRNVRIKEL